MNPLHNDQQLPDPTQSSSDNDQPTEEPTLTEKPLTTEDKTLQVPAPKVDPPAEEQTSTTSDEPITIAEPAKDDDNTQQVPAPKVAPLAEEQTSTTSDEPTIIAEPAKDDDNTQQVPELKVDPSAGEQPPTTYDQPTIATEPAEIDMASTLNQVPTQEVSAEEQDTNEIHQPPMKPELFPHDFRLNPELFPHDSRYTPEGMWPGYPQPVSTTPKQLSRLAHPWPLWAFLGGLGLIIVLLVVLHLTGSDWGNGAANASGGAAFIGIILVLALIVRSLDRQNSSGMASPLNPTRARQYITALICIIVVFIYSGISQALVPTLHIAQGRSLEAQQQWQAAIKEYQLGGEKAPNGADLARTYTSWGLSLNKAQHYDEAMTKFGTVITQFDSSTTKDQVKQAQSGDINARLSLAQQNMQANNYDAATNSYDTILGLPYCDTTCTTQVDALDATAYYNLGEQHLHTKDYSSAVTAFDTVLTKFSSAPEAKQLHGDMAKALLGEGQNTRASNCNSAIPTYQRLANEYSDTPEGQSATQDLHAPQTVTGNFANSNYADLLYHFSQMGLTHDLNGGMSSNDLLNAWDSAPQKTDIQSNGDFSFSGLAPGDYDLFWYGSYELGFTIYYKVEFIYSQTTSQPKYVAHVGPLCPVDMGKVTNATFSFTN